MQNSKLCYACGAELAGPFQPKIVVSRVSAPDRGGAEEKGEPEALKIAARSWVCPGCGLLHWYADDGDLDRLLEQAASNDLRISSPGSSYQRRTQILRMLRRVRRM